MEMTKVDGELFGGLVAIVGVAFETFGDDAGEFGREASVDGAGRGWTTAEDFVDEFRANRGVKRRQAGSHLIEDRAGSVNVGAHVDIGTEDLLRRHVRESASDHGGFRESFRKAAGFGRETKLGETEVKDLAARVGSDA